MAPSGVHQYVLRIADRLLPTWRQSPDQNCPTTIITTSHVVQAQLTIGEKLTQPLQRCEAQDTCRAVFKFAAPIPAHPSAPIVKTPEGPPHSTAKGKAAQFQLPRVQPPFSPAKLIAKEHTVVLSPFWP
jgi:hypothetical protein